MELEAIFRLLDSAGDNPMALLTALLGWWGVKSQLGQGKAQETAEDHKGKVDEIKEYARVIMRSLDCVVKAIDMSNDSQTKANVTELSKTDPDVRDVIIKAVDRRKIEENAERNILL